jgi:hypothetical protein
VTEAQSTINDEIERYLRTGESDPLSAAWSGSFMERANRANEDLRGAVVRTVRGWAEGLTRTTLPEADTVSLTRAKVEPVVRGLFPRAEQDVVLATPEQSVVFVTSANIGPAAGLSRPSGGCPLPIAPGSIHSIGPGQRLTTGPSSAG